jgi:hypothetical protein
MPAFAQMIQAKVAAVQAATAAASAAPATKTISVSALGRCCWAEAPVFRVAASCALADECGVDWRGPQQSSREQHK